MPSNVSTHSDGRNPPALSNAALTTSAIVAGLSWAESHDRNGVNSSLLSAAGASSRILLSVESCVVDSYVADLFFSHSRRGAKNSVGEETLRCGEAVRLPTASDRRCSCCADDGRWKLIVVSSTGIGESSHSSCAP